MDFKTGRQYSGTFSKIYDCLGRELEMELYQIWTTYNKEWSKRETILFGAIFVLNIVLAVRGVYREKINSIQAMAFLVLVVFLGIVFESTVFTRTCSVRQYELFPFWSWIEIIWKHDWSLLKQVLLNCLLLLPVGVLLPVIAEHKVKWYWGLGVGVLISVTIEICQLILKRGLFEWDDILHNGLGCMVGCLVVNIFKKEKNRD